LYHGPQVSVSGATRMEQQVWWGDRHLSPACKADLVSFFCTQTWRSQKTLHAVLYKEAD
jgi:hypothetical protein